MPQFEKGNTFGGRKKGSKNRITNDVRAAFHRVYEDMGKDYVDEKGKRHNLSGHESMLMWARLNPTEFYRLYGKMIPATAELPAELHEDFIEDLIFEDEQPKEVEARIVTDVGNEGQKQLSSGEELQDIMPHAPTEDKKERDVV